MLYSFGKKFLRTQARRFSGHAHHKVLLFLFGDMIHEEANGLTASRRMIYYDSLLSGSLQELLLTCWIWVQRDLRGSSS